MPSSTPNLSVSYIFYQCQYNVELNVGVEKGHNRQLDRPGMQHLMLPV